MSTRRISSVAYATDDNGSEAKTASATALPSRSWRACASGIGGPTSRRLIRASLIRHLDSKPPGSGRSRSSRFLRVFNARLVLLDTSLRRPVSGFQSGRVPDSMCEATTRSRRARMTPRPRWGLLYGIAAVVLAALAAVEIWAFPGAEQTVLRCGLALGGFAAMALWARQNCVALDQL